MLPLLKESARTRVSLMGGMCVSLLALLTAILIVNVYSDTQARVMIESMSPSARTLSFAVMTASATIIPLMLTILSFASRLEREFDRIFYRQVKLISLMSSIALILSVLVLLILTIPVLESDSLQSWFRAIYYILVFCVSILAGLIVSVVLLLYRTVTDIIGIVQPEAE